MVDEFILYDDAQYTRSDWRNRNLIKTRNGLRWLTIPVQVKGVKRFKKIHETKISDLAWATRHWSTVVQSYSQTAYFKESCEVFERLYHDCREECSLSRVNVKFIKAMCQLLGIKTKISSSMEYKLVNGKTERLVHLCQQTGAREYVSGPTAAEYIDENLFKNAGITLRYIDYSGYPEYHQLFPPFEHRVSCVDLIFNQGPHATKYMKSF